MPIRFRAYKFRAQNNAARNGPSQITCVHKSHGDFPKLGVVNGVSITRTIPETLNPKLVFGGLYWVPLFRETTTERSHPPRRPQH